MIEQREGGGRAHRLVNEISREMGTEATAGRQQDELEERTRSERTAEKTVALAVLTVALLALTYFNLSGRGPFSVRIEPLRPAEIEADLQSALDIVVSEITVFRQTQQRYPSDFSSFDLEEDDGEWNYQLISPDDFALTLTADNTSVSFDSRQANSLRGR